MHSPQNIATNIMAGNVLFNYCNSMLSACSTLGNRGRLNQVQQAELYKEARSISAHVTYFNSRTGSITTQPFEDSIQDSIKKDRLRREGWLVTEKERIGTTTSTITPAENTIF